jgi:hypothetical protein
VVSGGVKRMGGWDGAFLGVRSRSGVLVAGERGGQLPADHFACFVIVIVEDMDLAAFLAECRVDGHGAFGARFVDGGLDRHRLALAPRAGQVRRQRHVRGTRHGAAWSESDVGTNSATTVHVRRATTSPRRRTRARGNAPNCLAARSRSLPRRPKARRSPPSFRRAPLADRAHHEVTATTHTVHAPVLGLEAGCRRRTRNIVAGRVGGPQAAQSARPRGQAISADPLRPRSTLVRLKPGARRGDGACAGPGAAVWLRLRSSFNGKSGWGFVLTPDRAIRQSMWDLGGSA